MTPSFEIEPFRATATIGRALAHAAGTKRGFYYLEEARGERFQSYRDLYAAALVAGGNLLAHGYCGGDRIALVLPDSEAFLTAFLGASLAGLTPVPLYPPMNLGQLDGYLSHVEHIVRASRARAILTTPEVKRALVPLQGGGRNQLAVQVLTSAELDATHAPLLSGAVPLPSEPAFIQFTSGSTSKPKGVVLSHANLESNILALGGPAGIAIDPELDVGVSWLPLFHDMGLIGAALGSIYLHCSTVIIPPLLFLKRPREWFRAITRHKGTISFAPNFAYGLAARRTKDVDLAQFDLSSWRVAGCGAEPIHADTLREFTRRFAPAGFSDTAWLPCYGLAEHTVAVTFHRTGTPIRVDTVRSSELAERGIAVPCSIAEPNAAQYVSCGRPFPGHSVRILGDSGQLLDERQVGEVVLSGPSVMAEYDGDRELTADSMRHGWLHTGDLGYLVDGELHICGRKKDVIILNGRNYYPQDLERAIGDVEGVRCGSVVVFGSDAFGGSEKVIAIVERRGQLDERALAERVRIAAREACALGLNEVVVVPAGTLPKTSSGKLQRAQTKVRWETGKLLQSTEPTEGPRHVEAVASLGSRTVRLSVGAEGGG